MTSVGHYFTLSDFDRIKFHPNILPLSETVMNTIAFLNTNIEVPEFTAYVPRAEPVRSDMGNSRSSDKDMSTVRRHNRGGGGRNRPDPVANTEDWELMRSFKTTKMEIKTGVDKTINDILQIVNLVFLSS